MKYQILRFQSEQEFQNFFAQLASAEMSDFQAVDGSNGDGGFDGICGEVCYQSYYPEDKNRTDTNYIKKIDEDTSKIVLSSKTLGLKVTNWIFVVPEDLRMPVIAHLSKKSTDLMMKCTYWGATKLTELVSKHPHIQDSFPTIFLPPVQDAIKGLEKSINNMQTKSPNLLGQVEIVTDQDFLNAKQKLRDDHHSKVKSYYHNGRPYRIDIPLIVECEAESEKNYLLLKHKKERSDKAYEIELKEVEALYEGKIEQINLEMQRRGIYNSGIRLREIEKAEAEKQRLIEKTKLVYGKTGLFIIDDYLIPKDYYVSSSKNILING